jgi:hypothetical protein
LNPIDTVRDSNALGSQNVALEHDALDEELQQLRALINVGRMMSPISITAYRIGVSFTGVPR